MGVTTAGVKLHCELTGVGTGDRSGNLQKTNAIYIDMVRGDTVSSYKLAGESCSVSVYSGTSYSGMQWNNRHTVKNKNWSNRQCFNMNGPDNSFSSMSLTSYPTVLGTWQGPNTSDD